MGGGYPTFNFFKQSIIHPILLLIFPLVFAGAGCGGEDDSQYQVTVHEYCDMYKTKCGYYTELLSTCEGDYGKMKCSSDYVTFMNCALSNTDASCSDTELRGDEDIGKAKKICDDSWNTYKNCAY